MMPSLPLAIFDIGSNAVRLTIYAADTTGKVEISAKAVELCELGRLDPTTHALYPGGVDRARTALAQFCQMIRRPDLGVRGVVAVATEALRRASDGAAFMSRLKSEFNLTVQLLSPEEEGIYGARGVLRDMPDANGIVGDLGGGSLQLTRVQNGKIGDTYSMPIGTLRLLAATRNIGAMIDQALSDRPETLDRAEKLYIIGGSWRNLAKLYVMRAGERPDDVQGLELDPYKISLLVKWLYDRPRAEMTAILTRDYHFEEKRAQGLGVAGIALNHVIDVLDADTVIVSSAGIRDGILQAVLDGTLTPGPVPER